MSFTLLTQQEIEQIPHIIYEKILIEYNSVLDLNTSVNQLNIQNQYKIKDLNKQIDLLRSSMYKNNLKCFFLEIENEFCKLRVENLTKVLNILEKDNINNKEKKQIKEKNSLSSNIDLNLMSKLIRKIKTLSKKLNNEKFKYKKIHSEFLSLLRTKDQIYEDYCKNLIDSKKMEEYSNMLNKNIALEREYYKLMDMYNKLDYEYNKIILENRDLKYKYERYILSNRDDIIPVIGRELDLIKDNILQVISNIDNIFCSDFLNEFWMYSKLLKNKIDFYKETLQNVDLIKNEIVNIYDIINVMHKDIDKNNNLFTNLSRETQTFKEMVKDIFKEKLKKDSYSNVNYLFLEIYSYKQKIKKLETTIQEKEEAVSENQKIYEVEKEKCDNLINQLKEKEETIKCNMQIIDEKNVVIEKLRYLLTKLKKIKEEYTALKNNTNLE